MWFYEPREFMFTRKEPFLSDTGQLHSQDYQPKTFTVVSLRNILPSVRL